MVYINFDLNSVFLHNPKCGGVYVRNILEKYYGFSKSLEMDELHDHYNNFFEDKKFIKLDQDTDCHTLRKLGKYRYYTSHQGNRLINIKEKNIFTFVRNPYDRIYSAYKYLVKRLLETKENNKIRNSYENSEYFSDFNTFIKNKDNVNNISYFHSFITQFDQLINCNNKINIQYIGKMENMDSDLTEILMILGVDSIKHEEELYNNIKYNVSVFDNTNISDVINNESLQFINEYFKLDFELFDYKKCNSISELKLFYIKDKSSEKKIASCFNNISLLKYNCRMQNKLISKYEEIIKLLLSEIIKYEKNNQLIVNEITTLYSEINVLKIENKKTALVNKTKTNELTQDLFSIHKTITKPLTCSNCKFIAFNNLSFFAHLYFCC